MLTIVNVTTWDITHQAGCVQCGAPFQAGDVKVERDTDRGLAEEVCITCAYGPP